MPAFQLPAVSIKEPALSSTPAVDWRAAWVEDNPGSKAAINVSRLSSLGQQKLDGQTRSAHEWLKTCGLRVTNEQELHPTAIS